MNLFELFVKIGVDDQASGKLKDLGGKLGNGLATAAKIGTAAVGAAAAGITALTTAAVNNYAEYEQLVGGVETLFKNSADTVVGYAENAYKTAGLSANEYMSTVTSFSASLLQSLDGDTAKAADYADQAIRDMSDNANKMGTDMSMIQNAYQGFAKQNYTMLDNLKLGYGGTASEMYRLLERAAELDEEFAKTAEFSIDSKGHLTAEFADITQAIHIVQTEMGITGTTALEAGRTISGSVGSMKSAWTNLVTGFADGNANIEGLINNLVTTIVGDGTENNLGVIGNVLPAIETALGGIAKLIEGAAPKIIEILPGLVTRIVPSLISAATGMVNAVIAVLPDLLNTVVDAIIDNAPLLIDSALALVGELVNGVLVQLPQIVQLGLDLVVSLATGIAENLDTLIPTIIDVVLQIVDILTSPEQLQNLLDAALLLIIELAYGLMEAIPQLVDAALTIVENLVDFLLDPANLGKLLNAALHIVIVLATGIVNSIPRLVKSTIKLIADFAKLFFDYDWGSLGKEIVDGVLGGLKKAWSSLKKWFTDAWDNLVGGVKDLLGIHSPSRVFAGIGKNMALGVGEGWEDAFGDVEDEIYDSMDFGDVNYGIATAGSSIGSFGGADAVGGLSIVQNIYSEAKSAADLMREALWQQEKAVYLGV